MSLPRISVITPSLNSAATLPATLQSVREQGYPDLEHIVVDGGSTDGTVELLSRTAGIRWVSEPDRGLAHAMNKGLALATGEVLGWLNSDDIYLNDALTTVASAFAATPTARWATGTCIIIDARGREIRRLVTAYKTFLLRRYSYPLHVANNFVCAPSTFVRADAFAEVGGFDERFSYSMDYDLWLRLGRVSPPVIIECPIAAFRMAEGSLSMTGFQQQFAEHEQNARERGGDHRMAVAANVVASRGIVAVYHLLALMRNARRSLNASTRERMRDDTGAILRR